MADLLTGEDFMQEVLPFRPAPGRTPVLPLAVRAEIRPEMAVIMGKIPAFGAQYGRFHFVRPFLKIRDNLRDVFLSL